MSDETMNVDNEGDAYIGGVFASDGTVLAIYMVFSGAHSCEPGGLKKEENY